MFSTPTKQRVVIDCGGSHVSVGVFSFGEKGRRQEASARLRLESYARENFVCSPEHVGAWPAQIGAALDTVLAQLGLGRVRDCHLGIPSHLAITKLVKTPTVAAESFAQALRFEAAQAIPFPLDKVAWGGAVAGNDGEEMTLLITAAKLDALDSLCAAVEAGGVFPAYCESSAVALGRALLREVREPVLFVDVGARSTQVIIGGAIAEPVYLRTLNFGGNAVTRSLAHALGCDFASAEAAKQSVAQSVKEAELSSEGEVSLREAVQRAANAFAQKLGAELLLTKLAYLRQSGAVAPIRLYLCGGGSTLLGLREQLAEALSLPVAEVPPPVGVGVAASLAERMPIAASDWYTLCGLALGTVLPEAQQLNLLPPHRRAAREARVRRPWWFAAAALLVLLPLLPLLQQRSTIASLRAQAVAVDAATVPLQQLSHSNVQAEAEANELRTRLAYIQALNAGRENWLHFLADLQERLNEVGDVWLDRLHYKITNGIHRSEADILPPAVIEISGWLLDNGKTDEALPRLFDALQASAFVQRAERERYDHSHPGLIRFEAELLIAPEKPL